MLVYFIRGKLPWQGLKAKRHDKYLRVLEMKRVTSSSGGLPQEFTDYMNYVHNLRENDQPDYQHLRKMFTRLFRRQGFEYDNVFDWTIREFQRLKIEAQEPLVSKDVDEAQGADTRKPSDGKAQDMVKATRRKRK